MIFSGNTTALGATTIPMAEGYDCSYGASLALVESARNDLAMFKALVQADYKEMVICKESTGVMQEGEIAALHEAVGGGIFKKIADLFRKLVGKVKSIFASFAAKIRSLYMKDKEFVKKYQTEVVRKSGIDKLEVKWRKLTEKTSSNLVEFNVIEQGNFNPADASDPNKYSDDSTEREEHYVNSLGYNYDSASDAVKNAIDDLFESEETLKIGDIPGGIRGIISYLLDYEKKITKMNSNIKKSTSNLEKLVKFYDDKVKGLAKSSVGKDGNTSYKGKKYQWNNTNNKADLVDDERTSTKQGDVDTANKEYEMAVAYQSVMLAYMQICQQAATIDYKQHKAAFVKAVTVDKKKLEESMVYAEAIAEAAEQEVEDVISGALSKEELSDLTAASKNVMDSDVKDDPNALTYGPDHYTSNASFSNSDGNIDSRIGGGKVEETAYFGKMLW